MNDLNENVEIKSFLNKLEKYREDNLILLEILGTCEEYLVECFREDKINEKFFFHNLKIINSGKQDLNTIKETYINRLLIKQKQNNVLQNQIKQLLNELYNQAEKKAINRNVYERFKEYVDFTQEFHLSEKIY